MSKLANDWKKVKDVSEKLCKEKQKAGKKAEFPKFKSDFQKNLDNFEAAVLNVVKTRDLYIEAGKKVLKSADDCIEIIEEYTKAINNAEVEGLKSKEEVKVPMLQVLQKIKIEVERQRPKLAKGFSS